MNKIIEHHLTGAIHKMENHQKTEEGIPKELARSAVNLNMSTLTNLLTFVVKTVRDGGDNLSMEVYNTAELLTMNKETLKMEINFSGKVPKDTFKFNNQYKRNTWLSRLCQL